MEREAVEAVAGRDPEFRVEAVAAQDFEPFGNEAGLFVVIEAGELSVLVQRKQAAAGGFTKVAEAVEGNGGASVLEAAQLIPELGIGRRGFEFRILIVGDDCEDGLNAEALDEFAQALPEKPVHGGA